MALFDKEASTYDDWCKTPLGSAVDDVEKELMARNAQPQAGEKALDLGCGTGIYALWLKKQGLQVAGIDGSREMLAKAKDKADRDNLAIDWVYGDVRELPFPNETFDLVISNIVLEFVNDPGRVVSEALRVLKKGGRLVVGLIRKDGYWGKTYLKKGREHSDSVFAHAAFYSEETISSWEPDFFSSLDYGLTITRDNFESKDQALEMEKKLQSQSDVKNQSGFIVARWIK